MTREDPETVHRQRIDAFVTRARRIEAHTLAQDAARLDALANGTINVRGQDGVVTLRQVLPPEELVESAAARVRPLLLESDTCHYRKVIASIGYFLRHDPWPERLRTIRLAWESRLDPKTSDRPTGGFELHVTDMTTGVSASMSDVELALSWIYGDVVHHDVDRRQAGAIFGIRERYRAAVPLVAFTVRDGVRLLGLIRDAHAAGDLPVSEAALTEEVVVTDPVIVQEASAYMAPRGTSLPASAIDTLHFAWQELDPTTPPPLST